jgi:hypothetical protein
MKKLFALTMALLLLGPIAGSRGQQTGEADLRTAHDAWQDGKYTTALRAYLRLLRSTAGDELLEPIARQTGELFQTEELTTDGRAPRLSPRGNFIAYETGSGLAAMTRVVSAADGHALVSELPGTGAVFSPSERKVAYLKLPINDELKQAQAALDNPAAQGLARNATLQTLNYLQAKYAVIMLRDLKTQQETTVPTGSLLKSSLAIAADDEEKIYFIGTGDGETRRNDLYAGVAANVPLILLSESEGFKNGLQIAPGSKTLLYSIPNNNPSAPPRSQGNQNAAGGASNTGQGQRGQGGGGPPLPPTKFGILDLASRKTTVINGTNFALSADGAAVTYVNRAGQEYSLNVLPMGGESATLLKGTERLDAPVFSPDGQRLVYQKMARDDWELYLIGRDGKNETRLTREIQHDILPRFISNTRIIGMIGEPRHRRSYLYDLTNNTRAQLFHNNTVRTISPEYSWQANPEGTKLLVQADRDGNTVSAERGIYLVHLDRKVTKAELIARLEANLALETTLQDKGQRSYAPIAAEVRRVVEQASTNRIFEYEKTLFDFDSKHISRPGNKLASEYLFATYKSFGYEPEYQWFEARQALGSKTANVIAKLTGTENPELIYVVSSHFDSVAAGPGADDDTSGTAALLEAARVLAKHPQPATIIFASFTGEEAGLLGSREFVRLAQANKLKIVGALNNDMIGWANDNRLDNTIRYSNDGIRDIQHAAASLFTRLITYDTRYHRGTDATAFFEAYGDIVGGIGSYPVLGNPSYHQATDLLETINHQLITETSKTTVATLMLLAASPSRLKDLKVASYDGKTAELTWTAAPEKSVNGYIVRYGSPMSRLLQTKASTPRVTLRDVRPGTFIEVKAVNARGLEGWDWARITLTKPNTNAETAR